MSPHSRALIHVLLSMQPPLALLPLVAALALQKSAASWQPDLATNMTTSRLRRYLP